MANKVKLKDDEIISLLQPDVDKARAIQDELAIQREAYYNAFRAELYGNERAGWSQSVSPIVWVQHQATLSSLIEIFSDEFFTLKSSDEDRATKFQKLIRYQLFRKQDGYKRFYDFLFNAGLFHYSVFKVYYREDSDVETETIERLTTEQMVQLSQDPSIQIIKYTEAATDPVTDMLGMVQQPSETYYENVKVARKRVNYAGPWVDVLPPWEFFYSPDCKITDWGGIDGRLVYHSVKRTLNDIRKKERAGIYRAGTFDKCKSLGSERPQGVDEIAFTSGADDLSSYSTQVDNSDDLSKELVIKECYCKMDLDGDGLLEPCIVVIIEDSIVAQVEENPYERACFRIGGMLPEPHKINGIAPPAILDNDQKIMTNLLRFIQDSAAMSTYRNPITPDVRMQQMLQNRKPFDVILGDNGKIGEVPVQPPDNFILKAWELMKGENEEKTGLSRYNQGMDAESLNKTATGISLISQNSARRLRMSAKLLGNGAITGLIRDFIFINQKWKTQDPIQLLGTDIVVNPDDLDGEYDIEIDIGVSPAEKQASANQMDLLVQFGTQAGIQMGLMTPMHILKAQKKKYALLNINVDDCFNTEQQLQEQLMAQQMQQQQAMMGQPMQNMEGASGAGPAGPVGGPAA